MDILKDSTLMKYDDENIILLGGLTFKNGNQIHHRVKSFNLITLTWKEIFSEERNNILPTLSVRIPNNITICEE